MGDQLNALTPGFADHCVGGEFDAELFLYADGDLDGRPALSGTVAQSDVPEEFSATVPVEIQTGRGKVVRQLRTGSEPVPFSIPVTIANAKAVLDPGSSVLRR